MDLTATSSLEIIIFFSDDRSPVRPQPVLSGVYDDSESAAATLVMLHRQDGEVDSNFSTPPRVSRRTSKEQPNFF